MVNRVLQAKVFKMKRRGKHRTFSKAAVKQTINKERMQYYYHNPHSFKDEVPETGYLAGQAYQPRILAQIEARKPEPIKPAKAFRKVLINDNLQFVVLHFDSKMSCFVFHTFNRVHNYLQESIEYSNLARANEVWANNKVSWKAPKYFENVISPVTKTAV